MQIHDLQSNNLIVKIEEDQKLYLSMLDVIETIGLTNYRKASIPYAGNNALIGIIDDGINPNFETISNIIINKYTYSLKTRS